MWRKCQKAKGQEIPLGSHAFFDHERSYHSKAIKGKALTYCSKRVLSDRDVSILRKMPKSCEGTLEDILDQLQLDVPIEQRHAPKPEEASHQDMTLAEAGQHQPVNAHFPTVIFFEGQWVELHCKTCGANATRKGKAFFKDPNAFHWHAKSNHDKDLTKDTALSYCSKRVLSDRDVSVLCSKMPKSRDGTVTKILDQLRLDVRIEQWYYSKQGKAPVRSKYPRPEGRKRSFQAADLQESLPLRTTPDRRVKARPANLFRVSPEEEVKYADVMPRDYAGQGD